MPLQWNDYKDQEPDDAAKAIYAHIEAKAAELTGWYWGAIKNKKTAALWVRGVAFGMLIFGAALQIYASSVGGADARLQCTQGALALLVAGGLLLLGDRSFGWTSGWTRYIGTAMTMETLTSEFRLKWAKYLQLLESAIRAQRESTEKKLDEMRAAVDRKDSQAAERAASERSASKPGAIEVGFKFKGPPRRVKVRIDQGTAEEVLATSWSKLAVAPGQHQVESALLGDPPLVVSKIVEVAPATTARLEIAFDV